MTALHEEAGPRPVVPEVEIPAKATRRRFTAEYKRRIPREVDACTEPATIGALLRREGPYSSHLTKWRAQRAADDGYRSRISVIRRTAGSV